jgi:AGZA family xanthine/uracil permease-like MFS transporter
MNTRLDEYFGISRAGSTAGREFTGGLTTFITMSYILIVHPKIMEAAGIPFEASLVATVISAFFGTMIMGIYARRPFAIAPYMGENAFIAFTVVKVLGYNWQQALAAIFISGVLFSLLTVFKLRSWLANGIPKNMTVAFTVGIGLFLTFIGLSDSNMVVPGTPGAPVHVGDLTSQEAVFAVITFLIISVLMALKKNYAIIAGLFAITITGLISGNISLPEKLMSIPSDFTAIFWQMDFSGIFTWGFFPVILTVLVMDFVDTMGTLIGVSYKAGFLDENGNLPEIEKPMLTDALSTIIAAVSGTTTAGAFIESAAGVHAGARTGLASVFTALFFLLAIFFAPLLSVFPGYAYGPALVIVGMMMFSSVKDLKLDDISELIPAFTIIILMSFTFNMGIGMTAGFIVYPVMKIITGKAKEVTTAVWILAAVSAVFFVFYPY